MAAKLFHQLHPQRTKRDCGVACLATLLGRSYEEVLLEAASVSPNVLRKGLYASDLSKIALRFGVELRRRTSSDLEDRTGILEVSVKKREHLVFLVNGLVFDPEEGMQLWEIDVYLRHFKAVVQGLNEEVD